MDLYGSVIVGCQIALADAEKASGLDAYARAKGLSVDRLLRYWRDNDDADDVEDESEEDYCWRKVLGFHRAGEYEDLCGEPDKLVFGIQLAHVAPFSPDMPWYFGKLEFTLPELMDAFDEVRTGLQMLSITDAEVRLYTPITCSPT